MRLGRVWRVFIGEVGREVARTASSEIAEHVANALVCRVREVLGKPCHRGPTNGERKASAPPADDDER